MKTAIIKFDDIDTREIGDPLGNENGKSFGYGAYCLNEVADMMQMNGEHLSASLMTEDLYWEEVMDICNNLDPIQRLYGCSEAVAQANLTAWLTEHAYFVIS